MGNTVLWKPSEKAALAADVTMRVLEEAGLPPGVINLVHGSGASVSSTAIADPDFAGLSFTGSTTVFRSLWRAVGENMETYRSFPRLVGETGGKNAVLVHPSADVDAVRTALVRLVRVPGPEVLRRVPRLHRPLGLGQAARRARRPRSRAAGR